MVEVEGGGAEREIRLSWSMCAAGGDDDDDSKIELDQGNARIDLIAWRPTKLVV